MIIAKITNIGKRTKSRWLIIDISPMPISAQTKTGVKQHNAATANPITLMDRNLSFPILLLQRKLTMAVLAV